VSVKQLDVIPQIGFRERRRQVAGTAAADAVGGKLAVDFIDRVGGERRNQVRIGSSPAREETWPVEWGSKVAGGLQ